MLSAWKFKFAIWLRVMFRRPMPANCLVVNLSEDPSKGDAVIAKAIINKCKKCYVLNNKNKLPTKLVISRQEIDNMACAIVDAAGPDSTMKICKGDQTICHLPSSEVSAS
jgi:hypothetical protein